MTAATTHTFAFLAPYNAAAVLIGSWDGWQEHAMEKGDDHTFRLTLDLPEGTHRYRLRVLSQSWFFPGAWREIADPWAREVALAGAEGEETDCAIITVRDGVVGAADINYAWEHDGAPLPQNDMLILYELHVGDFTGGEGDDGGGRYTDVIAKLPYLADLGITAIELMPVAESAEDYWGYLPKYFYAPKTAYGNPGELKQLVDACHRQGIRVLLDVVMNHASAACPLAHIDHDYWFYHQNLDDSQFGPKFNYEFHDDERDEFPARAFMLGALQYWTEEYHVDGIRFDATRILDQRDFLREAADKVAHMAGDVKPLIRVAEHIPLDIAVVEEGGPVDAAWFADFAHQLLSTLTGQPVQSREPERWDDLMEVIDPRGAGFTSAQHVIRYITSHDEERLLHAIREAGIDGEEAIRRAYFAATLLLTGYGYPLLYAGEEFGMDSPRVFAANKLAWSRLEAPEGAGLHAHYRRLIRLRHEHPALRGETLEIFHTDPTARIVAYHRWDDGGDRVVVVAHCSVDDRGGYTLPRWPAKGRWRDVLTDDLFAVNDVALGMTLGPWQTRVFIQEHDADV